MSNKFNVKNCALLFGAFITGMLSVSISNIFGGYYCSVLAIIAVLSTLYVFDTLDKNTLSDNKLNVIFLCILIACETIFFVTNDIVGYSVYQKNNMGFFGWLVVGSQLFSVGVIAYTMISIVLNFFQKDSIELVDDVSNKVEGHDDVQEEIEAKKDEVKQEDVRRITQNNVRKEAPFMEEEI